MAKRPDWSHRLPRPLTIPGIMTLATLADVRALIEKHLPKEWRERSTWRVVADDLEAAARGADPREVEAALLLVLEIERVPCRPGSTRKP